nr:hypothetical protein [Planococcus glaciei]
MKIMIDAGHGPHTPGKRSPDGRIREFHFNSAVADEVKKAACVGWAYGFFQPPA